MKITAKRDPKTLEMMREAIDYDSIRLAQVAPSKSTKIYALISLNGPNPSRRLHTCECTASHSLSTVHQTHIQSYNDYKS